MSQEYVNTSGYVKTGFNFSLTEIHNSTSALWEHARIRRASSFQDTRHLQILRVLVVSALEDAHDPEVWRMSVISSSRGRPFIPSSERRSVNS